MIKQMFSESSLPLSIRIYIRTNVGSRNILSWIFQTIAAIRTVERRHV